MKPQLTTAILVKKIETSVGNCDFSSKMKSRLSIEALTKMMKKEIFL